MRGAVCVLNATVTIAARRLAFTGSSSHTSTLVFGGLAAVVLGVRAWCSRVGAASGSRLDTRVATREDDAMTFGPDLEERIHLLRASGCSPPAPMTSSIGSVRSHNRAKPTAGEELTRQGEVGLEFFVVVEGSAAATVDGDEVGRIGRGGFFGEMALIDGGDRVATVVALTAMQLLVLGRHDFNEMLEVAMPEIAPKLLAVVGSRLRAIEHHDGVVSTLGL